MGHIGFSYVGLIYLLMLFLPNLIWTKHRPQGYETKDENRLLLCLERVGEVSVTCVALIFSDFNLRPLSPWSLWLAGSFFLMLLYEFFWLRYFGGEATLDRFYGKLWFIPVPGASLPVFAFLLLGFYGKVIWMIAASIVLGVGHIGIHMQHCRELQKQRGDFPA